MPGAATPCCSAIATTRRQAASRSAISCAAAAAGGLWAGCGRAVGGLWAGCGRAVGGGTAHGGCGRPRRCRCLQASSTTTITTTLPTAATTTHQPPPPKHPATHQREGPVHQEVWQRRVALVRLADAVQEAGADDAAALRVRAARAAPGCEQLGPRRRLGGLLAGSGAAGPPAAQAGHRRAPARAHLPDARQAAHVDAPALLLALGLDDGHALRVAAHLRRWVWQGGRPGRLSARMIAATRAASHRSGAGRQARGCCTGAAQQKAASDSLCQDTRSHPSTPSQPPTKPARQRPPPPLTPSPCWRTARP